MIRALRTMIFITLIFSVFSIAFATVDAHDHAFVVVKHIQSEEYFVERVPIIGCYGLPQGPRLIQFTKEYKVTSNIGCGGDAMLDNINALTCAKVVRTKEADDFNSFSEIDLDISKCSDKNNKDFIDSIRKAARLNFPQSSKTKEVKLNLIK